MDISKAVKGVEFAYHTHVAKLRCNHNAELQAYFNQIITNTLTLTNSASWVLENVYVEYNHSFMPHF